MKQLIAPVGFALWLLAVIFWYPTGTTTPSVATPHAPGIDRFSGPFAPVSVDETLDPARVALGKRLFDDPLLSRDQTVSCATCHDSASAGTDDLAVAVGIGGRTGRRNAPTVFNARYNFRQFWDGRAATLEQQIDGPILSGVEMDSDWSTIVGRLSGSSEYRTAFGKIYPDGVTAANVADAIATFERSLVTPDSKFDRFLLGDDNALSAEEKQGYGLFVSYGCSSCHQGVAIGGNMFEKFGLLDPRFIDRSGPAGADLGRYEVTRDERDKYVFKVPSLRNVAVTAPYFHDGSAPTLAGAIVVMGRYQLGRELSADDVRSIAAFLQSLTGEYQGRPL